jgi:hypothetical protein
VKTSAASSSREFATTAGSQNKFVPCSDRHGRKIDPKVLVAAEEVFPRALDRQTAAPLYGADLETYNTFWSRDDFWARPLEAPLSNRVTLRGRYERFGVDLQCVARGRPLRTTVSKNPTL